MDLTCGVIVPGSGVVIFWRGATKLKIRLTISLHAPNHPHAPLPLPKDFLYFSVLLPFPRL